MSQYIVLIQGNRKSESTPEEWEVFIAAARRSGHFKGGSEIGKRIVLGDVQSAKSTDHIVGYMRFDSDNQQQILNLLEKHPVIIHGGSVELCEMPES
jgi:hypothetical protein